MVACLNGLLRFWCPALWRNNYCCCCCFSLDICISVNFSATEPLLPATSDVSVHHTLSASKLMNLGSRGFPFSRTGSPGTRIVSTKTVPTMYQSSKSQKQSKKSKDSQNSKNDNWCTNRHNGHMSTKTVPTVYQSSKTVKNSQKTAKKAKMRG